MINIKSEDHQIALSHEHFLEIYPKPSYGKYRPQPWSYPDKYPCLFKEIVILSNPNGPDHAVLSFEYDYSDEEA